MIFITAKFTVKAEHADEWPAISRAFTDAVKAEDGCEFFEWSRSLDDPNTYVLLEGYRDDAAGKAHVQSDHFTTATETLPAYLTSTPEIVNVKVDGWSKLGEMSVNE
ncbi:MAG: antibiotic biosynthesis monooxygenase [Acidobacteria bacterium]|nr:antibiotic biosynthesis monooxygenase [Acidobacteriota bacterium]